MSFVTQVTHESYSIFLQAFTILAADIKKQAVMQTKAPGSPKKDAKGVDLNTTPAAKKKPCC